MEDEEDLAHSFKDTLTQINGVEIFAFTSPLPALEHLKENHQKNGLVIADNRMPGLTGLQFKGR